MKGHTALLFCRLSRTLNVQSQMLLMMQNLLRLGAILNAVEGVSCTYVCIAATLEQTWRQFWEDKAAKQRPALRWTSWRPLTALQDAWSLKSKSARFPFQVIALQLDVSFMFLNRTAGRNAADVGIQAMRRT